MHCLGLLNKNDIVPQKQCLVVSFWSGLFHQHLSLTDSYTFSGTPQFLEPGALVQMCKSKHIALVAPTYTPTRVILKVLEGPHNQAISVQG